MSNLGTYIKQPVEIEIYGIQFAKDMATTDQITTAWQMIARQSTRAWDQIVKNSPYTVMLEDDGRQLVVTTDVTLPNSAADGFRINVANQNQVGAITVGSVSVPARGATVIARVDGAWIEEAKTQAVLVDAIGDQRVRTRVFGGTPYQEYRVEITVDTTEGRRMQNEFTVQIEES